ncbi:lysylphosphatidylglycerol synthase domain-containing protein [Kribbella sp. HUAS MG21]|uniref:Lysylphosphatidylglycerol synthase domain-containing protein n=1 Tax=Kribbella sp. HUAS MG21 TaxID=3160966 RepID=A0AAU7T5X6_9ACTN
MAAARRISRLGSVADPASTPTPTHDRRRLPKPLLRTVRIALIVVVVWLLLRLLRGVDWSEVGYALTHLAVWQIAVLLVVMAVRRFVSAAPLALLIPGLSAGRAMVNDVAATAVATLAPSPGDVMIRLAMLRSWQIDPTNAASGLTLSTLLFYVARLAAPFLGFVLFWAAGTFYAPFGWSALVFGAGAAALLGGLLYALRAERTAAAVGRLIGGLLRRVRPTTKGPDAWAELLVSFQAHSAGTMRRRGRLTILDLLALVLVEAGLIVLCMAFVGAELDRSDVVLLACSFMVVYPLTGLPLMGAGVLEATYVTFVSEHSEVEATALMAGLIVWRVAVQFVPVLVGLLTIVVWRRTHEA